MANQIDTILSKTRLETITDGFFATVLTILVLSLVVPTLTGSNLSNQLSASLEKLTPDILSYIISFLILGVLWIAHNNIFRYIAKADRKLQWITVLFLLSVGFIPFSTALLGRYPLQQITVMFFGVNLLATAIIFSSFWKYASHNGRLLHRGVTEKRIGEISKSTYISLVAYTLAIAFSFVSAWVSLAIFAFVPIYYISVGLITEVKD